MKLYVVTDMEKCMIPWKSKECLSTRITFINWIFREALGVKRAFMDLRALLFTKRAIGLVALYTATHLLWVGLLVYSGLATYLLNLAVMEHTTEEGVLRSLWSTRFFIMWISIEAAPALGFCLYAFVRLKDAFVPFFWLYALLFSAVLMGLSL